MAIRRNMECRGSTTNPWFRRARRDFQAAARLAASLIKTTTIPSGAPASRLLIDWSCGLMRSMRCGNVPVRATRISVKYNSERGFGPSRPKSWRFLQVASLEVIEAVARGTEGGRIGFTHRRFSFFGRPGDFNVAMRRLRHCPNGFPRFCNVAARGVAATLKSRHLRMRLWAFRHIVTLKGG